MPWPHSSFKSRLVVLFWYRLTPVILEKRPLNGSNSSSSSSSSSSRSVSETHTFFPSNDDWISVGVARCFNFRLLHAILPLYFPLVRRACNKSSSILLGSQHWRCPLAATLWHRHCGYGSKGGCYRRDRRTNTWSLHRPCSVYYADSVSMRMTEMQRCWLYTVQQQQQQLATCMPSARRNEKRRVISMSKPSIHLRLLICAYSCVLSVCVSLVSTHSYHCAAREQ